MRRTRFVSLQEAEVLAPASCLPDQVKIRDLAVPCLGRSAGCLQAS